MRHGSADGQPPSGFLTFLFTDLVGSTRLWERHPHAMKAALDRHDKVLRDAVEAAGGTVVKTTGDGIMAVFASAPAGATAAIDAQRRLLAEPWPETGPLRVRMGLHCGTVHISEDDYHGPAVNRSARIMAIAHGGQILLSGSVAEQVQDLPPPGARLEDLGEHRLKDLERPERIFQLGHAELPSEFPPLASLSERPNNLPMHSTSFIGRERELAEIRERVASGAVRLLTLVGPGGTGKTRLALQAAADLIESFDDGVFFVDLAEAHDPEALPALIARATGLDEVTEERGLEELMHQLRTKAMLLVLDNFEQVISASSKVATIIESSPQLSILVTSRESLRVRAEHVLSVAPLGLPIIRSHRPVLAALRDSEAVRLFVDRGRSVRPDFDLNDENAAAVAAICELLDGLPLAIELAAARLSMFTPEALLDRLRGGTEVLSGRLRDLPTRQQTLRDTIGWSYELLDPSERTLFRLLAVFSEIGVETVEGVVADMAVGTDFEDLDAIEGLASLLDKSLLRREVDTTGAPRFSMLRTIREYAAERLSEDSAFAEAARHAHAAYFATLARQVWGQLGSRKRNDVLAQLRGEAENLQAAWRHWVEAGDLERLNDLVDSLWFAYDAWGWHQANVDIADQLLSVLASKPATEDRVRQEVTMLTSLARMQLGLTGYTPEVEETYNRARELAEIHGVLDELFPVLRGLSYLYNYQGDYVRGLDLGRKMLELADRQGDVGMRLEAHLVTGTSTLFLNDVPGGLEHLGRAIDLIDVDLKTSRRFRFGPYPGVSALTTSALVEWLRGEPERAERFADRALAVATELDHPYSLAYARYHVGFLHMWRQEPHVAKPLAEGVLEVAEAHDLVIWQALGTCLVGAAETWIGEHERGLALIEQGMEVYQGLKAPPVFWSLLLWLKASALGRVGHTSQALAVLEAAMALETDSQYGWIILPEFGVLMADLLGRDEATRADAIAVLRQAYDVSTQVGLSTGRLRAALHLVGLVEPEERDGALTLLREAMEGFAATASTVDLREAARVLAESGRPR
jgi:predicted ATPase/class 3 adenylate cyclase